MLKETLNNVVVEGIISEIDIDLKSYKNKQTGADVPAIGGSIKVRLSQEIEGIMHDLEVPVSFFTGQFTKAGGENPSFANIKRAMEELKSIAAVGEEEADRVRITGAKTSMNSYFNQEGRLVSFPRLQASFITKIKPEDCNPRAVWEAELYIAKMEYLTDKDGVETDAFEIQGVSIGYGERAEIIKVVTNRPSISTAIKNTYQIGDTVPMSGKLLFTSKSETFLEEVEIGDPIEKHRTINISDLIITGVKGAKDGDAALNADEVKVALEARLARLEALKASTAAAQGAEKKAPNKQIDLGF